MDLNSLNITSAQWIRSEDNNESSIAMTLDGKTYSVPKDPANRHYAEILKQVAAGTLTIKAAD